MDDWWEAVLEWLIARGDMKRGPLSLEELKRDLVEGGADTARVWRLDFADWRKPEDVPELAMFVRAASSVSVGASAQPLSIPEGKPSLARRILYWCVGIILVLAGGRIFGGGYMLPAMFVGFTWFVLRKCQVRPAIVPVLALLIGQTVWLSVRDTILIVRWHGDLNDAEFLFDLLIVVGLSFWVLRWTNIVSLSATLLYVIVALVGTFVDLQEESWSASDLIILLILRALATGAGVYALVKSRKSATERPAY